MLKKILHIGLGILSYLGVFMTLLVMWFTLADLIDVNNMLLYSLITDHLFIKILVISLLITLLFYFKFRRNEYFVRVVSRWVMVLHLSIIMGVVLGFTFGQAEMWYLKYIIGLMVGLNTFFFTRTINHKHKVLIGAGIAMVALLYCEHAEYMKGLDPAPNPSTLSIFSFPNLTVWLLTIAMVAGSAALVASGFSLKPFRKDE